MLVCVHGTSSLCISFLITGFSSKHVVIKKISQQCLILSWMFSRMNQSTVRNIGVTLRRKRRRKKRTKRTKMPSLGKTKWPMVCLPLTLFQRTCALPFNRSAFCLSSERVILQFRRIVAHWVACFLSLHLHLCFMPLFFCFLCIKMLAVWNITRLLRLIQFYCKGFSLIYPLVLSSTPTGVETPDVIDLRKAQRKEPEKQLYQVNSMDCRIRHFV